MLVFPFVFVLTSNLFALVKIMEATKVLLESGIDNKVGLYVVLT